jgi:hypothetical protein
MPVCMGNCSMRMWQACVSMDGMQHACVLIGTRHTPQDAPQHEYHTAVAQEQRLLRRCTSAADAPGARAPAQRLRHLCTKQQRRQHTQSTLHMKRGYNLKFHMNILTCR